MVPGVYGVDAVSVSVHAEPGLAVTAGAGYPSPLGAQSLLSQRHEVGVGIGPSVSTDISRERSVPSRSGDGLPVLKGESNILFVDGLPTDCTRREVGRILLLFVCLFFNACQCFRYATCPGLLFLVEMTPLNLLFVPLFLSFQTLTH